jgi:hypothetical protein
MLNTFNLFDFSLKKLSVADPPKQMPAENDTEKIRKTLIERLKEYEIWYRFVVVLVLVKILTIVIFRPASRTSLHSATSWQRLD